MKGELQEAQFGGKDPIRREVSRDPDGGWGKPQQTFCSTLSLPPSERGVEQSHFRKSTVHQPEQKQTSEKNENKESPMKKIAVIMRLGATVT